MKKSVIFLIGSIGVGLAFPSVVIVLITASVMGSFLGGITAVLSFISYVTLVGILISITSLPILFVNSNIELAKLFRVIIIITGILVILCMILGMFGGFNFLLLLGLFGGAAIGFFGLNRMGIAGPEAQE
jgi:hypothetical protein